MTEQNTSESDCDSVSEVSSIDGCESPSHLQSKLVARGAFGVEAVKGQLGSWSCVLLPHKIIPEAFHDTEDRVIKQIAVIWNVSIETIKNILDQVLDDPQWRQRQNALTPLEVAEMAKYRGVSCYLCNGRRLDY